MACSVAGCDRTDSKLGMCAAHHARWRRNGDTGGAGIRPLRQYEDGEECSIDGCSGTAASRGWCRSHYGRWQRHGDPLVEPTPPKLGQPCRVDDCTDFVSRKSGRGLCSRHYQRLLLTGSPTGSTARTVEQRFFEKIRLAGECWEWTASLDQNGYGLFKTDHRMIRSHIWVFEFFVVEVPKGLQLDHVCHTNDLTCKGGLTCPHRRCANPWHLEPVSPMVNSRRGVRSRPQDACPSGHKWEPETTYINPKGRKVCRICSAISRARYENRKRVA